jgi:NhaP-type Na+/H+ or K+/H+ antiporter
MDFDTYTRNVQTATQQQTNFIDYGLLGFNFREIGFLFCGLFCGFLLWILIRRDAMHRVSTHETHPRKTTNT